jgi:hypothetical protein
MAVLGKIGKFSRAGLAECHFYASLARLNEPALEKSVNRL